MISVSFIVKSSSLVPDFKSLTTEGLIHSGGTRSRVRIKSEGLPACGFIRSRGMSSTGILLKRFNTTKGFKFSYKIHWETGRRRHHVKFQCFPPPPLILLMFRNSLFQRQIENYSCKLIYVLVYLFWTNAFSISDINLLHILSIFPHICVFTSYHVALLSQELMGNISLPIEKATQHLKAHCIHFISKKSHDYSTA